MPACFYLGSRDAHHAFEYKMPREEPVTLSESFVNENLSHVYDKNQRKSRRKCQSVFLGVRQSKGANVLFVV